MTPWGYHLILNCSGCSKNHTDSDSIRNFVDELIANIDMVKFGDLQLYYMDQEENSGWSFTQLITTSNICGHFVDLDGRAFIDVFSCKEFDADIAIQTVKEYFDPREINHEFIARSA